MSSRAATVIGCGAFLLIVGALLVSSRLYGVPFDFGRWDGLAAYLCGLLMDLGGFVILVIGIVLAILDRLPREPPP